jgi:hypothetical protein
MPCHIDRTCLFSFRWYLAEYMQKYSSLLATINLAELSPSPCCRELGIGIPSRTLWSRSLLLPKLFTSPLPWTSDRCHVKVTSRSFTFCCMHMMRDRRCLTDSCDKEPIGFRGHNIYWSCLCLSSCPIVHVPGAWMGDVSITWIGV